MFFTTNSNQFQEDKVKLQSNNKRTNITNTMAFSKLIYDVDNHENW